MSLYPHSGVPDEAHPTLTLPFAKGGSLKTLRDAANLIRRLPKAERDLPHWQAATEALIMAAEDRGKDGGRRLIGLFGLYF